MVDRRLTARWGHHLLGNRNALMPLRHRVWPLVGIALAVTFRAAHNRAFIDLHSGWENRSAVGKTG